MIDIRAERWAQFWPDCLPLMREHDAELAEHDPREPFAPDNALFAAIDAAGASLLMAARLDGRMIGYCIFNLSPSLRTKGLLCAEQSLWFVTREHRGSSAGIRLFDRAIAELRGRGVRKVYPHHWLVSNSPRAEAFFLRRGATELERVYSMWIES
jgi:GNAT superfamily N-acetyltransferase